MEEKNNSNTSLFDIKTNVWIEANAGSGKTTALVNRFLSLILEGEKIENIICITYSKTGASEMKQRIVNKIESWSKENEDYILKDLESLNKDQSYLNIARNIAKNIQNSDVNFNIQTIHAFCFQKIFEIKSFQKKLNNFENENLKFKVKKFLFSLDNILNIKYELINKIFNYYSEYKINKIIEYIINNIYLFEDILLKYNIKFNEKSFLEIESKIKLSYIEFYNYLKLNLEKYHNQIPKRKKMIQDGTFISNLRELEQEDLKFYKKVSEAKNDFLSIFFEEETLNLKTEILKKQDKFDNFLDKITIILKDIEILEEQEKENLIYFITKKIINNYKKLKKEQNLISFDDILYESYNILNSNEFGLKNYINDLNIHHLLIDEAQDTNEISWKIIEKLTEDFFTGYGLHDDKIRTIFCVGDPKQSIFSFQGAKPSLFYKFRDIFEYKSKKANIKFLKYNLNISYRTSYNILNIVDEICNNQNYKNAYFNENKIEHKSNRNTKGIFEEILIKDHNKKEEKLQNEKNNWLTKNNLKSNLTDEIFQEIQIIYKKNKNVKIGILFKDRSEKNALIYKLYIKIKNELEPEIECLGSKIKSEEEIDLILILKYILDSADELNLGSLLKSKNIFNLCDLEIYEIINNSKISKINEYKGLNLNILNAKRIINKLLLTKKKQSLQNILIQLLNFFKEEHFNKKDEYIFLLNKIFNIIYEDSSINLIKLIKIFEENSINSMLSNLEISTKEKIEQKKITISTIHSAKGMEFDVVFLIDTSKKIDQIKEYNPILLNEINDNFILNINEIKKRQKEDSRNENLRLLYVAVTRTINEIYLIRILNNENSEDKESFGFIINELSKNNT